MEANRIRSLIQNQSRASLRRVAASVGCHREVLDDFAEANILPEADVLAKLTAWACEQVLRDRIITDPVAGADCPAATGIAPAHIERWAAGDEELTAAELERVRAYFNGEYGRTHTGDWQRNAAPAAPVPFGNTSPGLGAEHIRRTQLLGELGKLSTEQLEAALRAGRAASTSRAA